jgi:hypothetical protein
MKPAVLSKLFLLLTIFALWSGSAHAVEIRFAAEVTEHRGSVISEITPVLPIGVEVTGLISYEQDADVVQRFETQNGLAVTYLGSGFSIAAGGFRASTSGQDLTIGDGRPGLFIDQLVNWADNSNIINSSGTPLQVFSMTLGLRENTGTLFNSTAVPDANLSLGDFDENGFEIFFVRDLQNPAGDNVLAIGRVTSLTFDEGSPIPEPSTIALLALGMLGFAMRKLRR